MASYFQTSAPCSWVKSPATSFLRQEQWGTHLSSHLYKIALPLKNTMRSPARNPVPKARCANWKVEVGPGPSLWECLAALRWHCSPRSLDGEHLMKPLNTLKKTKKTIILRNHELEHLSLPKTSQHFPSAELLLCSLAVWHSVFHIATREPQDPRCLVRIPRNVMHPSVFPWIGSETQKR